MMEYVVTAICWDKDGTKIGSYERAYKDKKFAEKRYDDLVQLYSKYPGWAVWLVPRIEVPTSPNSVFKKIGLI